MDDMSYRKPSSEVLEALKVDPEQGVTADEAARRLDEHGPNELREAQKRSAWAILAAQFKSLVVLLLVAAGTLSVILGDWTEAAAIAAVVVINALIGFFTELKAMRSMEALKKLGTVDTTVRRGGDARKVPATELVPGDVVLLEGGDVITADCRILEASRLQCDESSLTGESVPVTKQEEALEGEVPLAERTNMIYKGTSVTNGSGEAVVVATGMQTELGEISSLVEEAEAGTTPLEKRLDALGKRLVWVVLGIAVVVAVLGVLRDKELFLMIETAVALAVASIPEGLPIVATIALSRGMMRMARRRALVNRLASVETLGSTTVICTDKTGTLTENDMTVTRIGLGDGSRTLDEDDAWQEDGGDASGKDDALLREALRLAALCNNAELASGDEDDVDVGDPMEVALLEAARTVGLERSDLLEKTPEEREEAFDSETKMMATYHRMDEGYGVAVKGAPEAVIAHCTRLLTTEGEAELDDAGRKDWTERNEQLARDGFRVLAVARKTVGDPDAAPYEDLTLVGLLGLLDPPRRDIKPTIELCHKAGIRIVMVTGDQATTARNVAQAVGIESGEDIRVVEGRDLKPPGELAAAEEDELAETSVFARVDPRQKLDLIALHQKHGAVVAMTGDGVNDAPALKKADIGVAMGIRGTQVAQQVADVVLRDDSFKTIVYAVEEGRVIFGNIRKFVLYLLSCNVGEVFVIFVATLLNTTLPLRPLQILFLNLVTDVFPALALGAGEGSKDVMDHPPRSPEEPILTRRHWGEIALYGAVMAAVVLGAFLATRHYLGLGDDRAITVAFLTLAFAQLWHVFNMRGRMNIVNNQVTRNPWVWGALALCTGLLAAAVYVPILGEVLGTTVPGWREWALILGCSILPVGFDFVYRAVAGTASR